MCQPEQRTAFAPRRRAAPQDYDYHPVTFVLPTDREKLLEYAAAYATVTAACKPALAPAAPSSAAAGAAPAPVPAAPSAVATLTPTAAASKSVATALATLAAGGVGNVHMPHLPGKGLPPAAAAGGHTPGAAAGAAGDPLVPPPHGCWPPSGVQAQPQAASGDRLVYIVKPDVSSRGNGIYLALTLADIRELQGDATSDGDSSARGSTPSSSARSAGKGSGATAAGAGGAGGDTDDEVAAAAAADAEAKKLTLVQCYLPRPLLMDNRKFDLRIYVLVTSAFPTLRVFIYRQGLVRFATEDYAPPTEANVRHRKMFLTNYAVNKPTGAGGGISDDVLDDASVASDDVPDGDADGAGSGSDDDEAKAGAGCSSGSGGGGAGGKKKGGKRNRVPWPLPSRAKQRDIVQDREGCKWTIDALFNALKVRRRRHRCAAVAARCRALVARALASAPFAGARHRYGHAVAAHQGHHRQDDAGHTRLARTEVQAGEAAVATG